MKLPYRLVRLAGIAILGLSIVPANATSPANAAVSTHHRKPKKPQPQLPLLPSGPTGPVPAIPLDSMTPVAPQVTYENGKLTIIAPNSTLADVLRAVRKQTGAEIEIPTATDRVVTRLGPGPVQEIMSELLNGSRFNYVLLGSPQNADVLRRVVLVPKSGAAESAVNQPMQPQQPYANQAANVTPQDATDTTDAEPVDDNTNAADNSEAQPDQDQSGSPDQPGVKTPQQLLQEMQQRQLLLQQQQQQQQPGQPPIPGAGVPQRPEQDQ
jgi:hypothetical protein